MAKALTAPRPLWRLPAWARRQHPVVREELRRWKWFPNRGGRQAAAFFGLILLAPLLCGGSVGLGAALTQAEWIGVAGATTTLAALALSGLVHWLMGLAATIFGATLIAREREEQRWPYLRVTPLTSTEIVGGKLASLLYMLRWPMHLAAALRLFALGAGALTLALLAVAGGVTAAEISAVLGEVWALAPEAPPSLLLTLSVGGVDLAAALVFWLAQPYYDGLYNAVVGLTASTFARTRGLAIGLAFATHLVLSLVIYAPAQQIAYILIAAFMSLNGGRPSDTLLGLLVAGPVQIGLSIAIGVGVIAGCLALSVQRVERLGD
jgi:hypothetical protein